MLIEMTHRHALSGASIRANDSVSALVTLARSLPLLRVRAQ